jgi:hypothetical protein
MIVCDKCEKKYSLEDLCEKASLHVFYGFGDESNCCLCGKPNGGSCIDVPQKIVERVKTAANTA